MVLATDVLRVSGCPPPVPLLTHPLFSFMVTTLKTNRVQEVEELRQKLQEVEIGTALSQADSNFLQRELEEKEADIGEEISQTLPHKRCMQCL